MDARHWGRRDAFDALEKRQLETATHWLPTHTEGLTLRELKHISRQVAAVNPYAAKTTAASLAAELFLPRRTTPTPVCSHSVTPSDEKAPNTPTAPDRDCDEHTHERETKSDPAHALSHRFTGCQFSLPGTWRREQVIRYLELLPDEVVRAKALVKLADSPGSRWLFERTGRHRVENPLEVTGVKRAKSSVVLIGPRLDREALLALTRRQLGGGVGLD